jgi:hypothetical protein
MVATMGNTEDDVGNIPTKGNTEDGCNNGQYRRRCAQYRRKAILKMVATTGNTEDDEQYRRRAKLLTLGNTDEGQNY